MYYYQITQCENLGGEISQKVKIHCSHRNWSIFSKGVKIFDVTVKMSNNYCISDI